MTRNTFTKTAIKTFPYFIADRRHSSLYNETISFSYPTKGKSLCVVINWKTWKPEAKSPTGKVSIYWNDTNKHEREWNTSLGEYETKEEYIEALNGLEDNIKEYLLNN